MITDRFKGAEYMSLLRKLNFAIVGQGGIGSPFCITISRALSESNVTMFGYEYDVIEAHNIGGQFFRMEQIGKKKDESIMELMEEFSYYYRFTPLGKFEQDSEVHPIMFMAVDHNPTRYLAFQKWREEAEKNNWEHTVLIEEEDGVEVEYKIPYMMFDGRLAFNQMELYCITKHTEKAHEQHNLHRENNNLVEDGCTTKANPEQGYLVGNFMFTWYRNFLQNVIDMNQGFPATKWCPYKWTFNLSTGKTNTYGSKSNFI